jgi:hypothetical protein
VLLLLLLLVFTACIANTCCCAAAVMGTSNQSSTFCPCCRCPLAAACYDVTAAAVGSQLGPCLTCIPCCC